MLVSLASRRFLVIATAVSALATQAAALDTDLDGLEDNVDNCVLVPNSGAEQCDTDADGFGNACDADYTQDGAVSPADWPILEADYASGSDSGVGTDHNCDGVVSPSDLHTYIPQYEQGAPGPSGLICAGFEPCLDADHDGVADHLDNCTGLENPSQCDTDQDGYGNQCDGDFNQDGIVGATDSSDFMVPDFQSGVDSGVGTDMNCDGLVTPADVNPLFSDQFEQGHPGPSALPCAGVAPCLAGDPDLDQETVFRDPVKPNTLQSATDTQGRMHGVYGTPTPSIEFFSQSSPDGSLTRETIAGESVTHLDLAFDSANRPCVAWLDGSAGDMGYGCQEAGGFLFDTDASDIVVNSTAALNLAVDSQDGPHMGIYQHVHSTGIPGVPDLPNHRVHHLWRDGNGDWNRQMIPLPPEYGSGTDWLSNAVCVAIDDTDRVHFVFSVGYDYLLKDPAQDYLGALAHAIWSPANGWESSSVIRADIGGDLSPKELGRSCELRHSSDGTLYLAYDVTDHDPQSSIPTHRFYGRNAGAGWTFTDLGEGGLSGDLDIDSNGSAFLSSALFDSVDLLRIDGPGAVHTESIDAYRSVQSAISVWNPDPVETTCRVLYTKRFSPEEDQFVLATIRNCDEP